MRPTPCVLALALVGVLLNACGRETPPPADPAVVAPSSPSAATHEHPAPAAEPHDHGSPSAALPAEGATRWATDAALIEGMQAIRTAVADARDRAALDAPAADRLATTVEERVAFLIANCRLAPEADATLHVLIGGLLRAAAAVRVDPASADGLPAMRETLRAYPRYFEHPGWVPIDAGP